MKFKWGAPGPLTKLSLHGECDGYPRVSYIGAVHCTNNDEWHALAVELEEHPVLIAAEDAVYKTRLGAMRALRKAFVIAWMGATKEERDSVWD